VDPAEFHPPLSDLKKKIDCELNDINYILDKIAAAIV
jgi:hypothetical protein